MNRARCALKVGLIHRSLCSSASGNAPLPTLYPKKLGDIFNMDKLLTEYPLYTDDKGTVNEASIMAIQQIWLGANSLDSSKSTHALTAVLPDHVRRDWLQRASICPLALVPVFHEADPSQLAEDPAPAPNAAPINYRMMISQFQQDSGSFILTHLEDYQRNPATAAPWCTVSLYSMLGEDDMDSPNPNASPRSSTSLLRMEYVAHLLTPREAQFVATRALPLLFSDPGATGHAHDYTGSVRHAEGDLVDTALNVPGAGANVEAGATCAGLFDQLSFLNLAPNRFALDTYVKALHGVYSRDILDISRSAAAAQQ